MKTKTTFLCCLACVIILAMGYEYSRAQQKTDIPSPKIGAVSILKIFRDCKRSASHQAEMKAEIHKQADVLKKLSEQLKSKEAMLGVLKQDSSDYLTQREEYIKIKTGLEAQREFFNEQKLLKEFRWGKELYRDILRIIREVAEQKGLVTVLETKKIDVPELSLNEFNEALRTHKVLYSGGCIDITDEVIVRLDKGE